MKTITDSLFTLAIFLFYLGSTSAYAALIERSGGMIYDDDLNVTWLADANYSMTSGYDSNGSMRWNNAMSWADNLDYGGYTDWRLPAGDSDCGWSYNCEESEMGHLFYIEGISAFSFGLFENMPIGAYYWTSTDYPPDTNFAWIFGLTTGQQGIGGKSSVDYYVIAGRNGDVSEPSIIFLFGLGMLGLARFKRKTGVSPCS